MGKRHNTLSDSIFRNSKYINTLEKELDITDFRKDYKEQYDIMLDVYKTLISINNIFFADSNKNKNDKQNEILELLEQAIYKSPDDDRAKYSVRTVKGLIDSNTRLLYNRFSDWYEKLSYNDKYYDSLKMEIEEEMTRLENIGFDNVVKSGFQYAKNKNSDYKIYTSKLDYLYPNKEKAWEEYKKELYDIYGIEINQQERNDIYFVFKLIAYANNGIVKLLFQDETPDFDLSARNNADDFFKAYLTCLNINIEDNDMFMKKADIFLNEAFITNNVITEQIEHKTKNKHILQMPAMTIDFYIANYDLIFFYVNMEKITSGLFEFTIKADFITKLIKDLKEIYTLMYDNVPTMTDKEQVQNAFSKVQNIIDRNKKMFERLS